MTALNREAIIAHRAVTASRVVIGGGHAAKFRTFDPSPIPWQVAAFEDRAPILLLTGSAGGGKALALTTPIPTPNGWATMASLMPGDSVFDECGQPCRVLATSEIMYGREVFDVYFDDGSVIRADGEHLWLTSTVASRASKRNNPFPVPTEFKLRGSPQVRKTDAIVTTKHIRETLRTVATSRRINHAVCNAAPLQLPEVLVPIPPYVLGAWLGDGTSKAGEITGIDQPIFDRIASFGYRVAPQPTQRMRQTIYGLQASLRALGVLNNKHIPSVYLRASEHQRRELLWGLMDTDGTALPSGSVEFYSTNRRLVEGVLELIHSLGFKASICTGRAMLYDKDCGEKYRIKFTTSEPVFALKRKIERQVSKERGVQRRRFIIDVVPVPTEPVRCIEVSSSSGLFLAGRDMIPTHNSRLGYEMGHNFMVTHPGAMGLMVRKTRESMRNSTVLFFKSRIADQDSRVELVTSSHRFQYTNGSFLAYGGMKDEDQREQIRSIGVDGALDFALIEEANRLTFEDFQEIFPRMRGKAGPYCQLILMTNPDAPRHWINEKLIKGGMAKVYYSSAADNPYNPPEYAAWLNMLTGVQRRRLVDGKWEQAEGVIYDNFSAIADNDSNVTPAAEYDPALGIVLWGCDDGYARGDGPGTLSYHPRIILLAQETAQGGLNIFDEYYRVEEPSYEASINDALARGYPMPGAAFCDSSAAMFRANLMNRGIMTSGATHSVTEGIRNLRRLICDAKGMRLLKIHPRCVNLIGEFQSYRYDEVAQVAGDRKPLKMDDHGCFVAGTLVETDRGPVPIEQVSMSDLVLTRAGFRRVIDCGLTAVSAVVYTVECSDGRTLTGTGNHPVWIEGSGFVNLSNLTPSSILHVSHSIDTENGLCRGAQHTKSKPSSIKASPFGVIPNRLAGLTLGIIARTLSIFREALRRFIGKSGGIISGLSLMVRKSIIKTAIQTTTIYPISSLLHIRSMPNSTSKSLPSGANATAYSWNLFDLLLPNGIAAMPDGNGIGSTVKTHGKTEDPKHSNVRSVGNHTIHCIEGIPDSVPITVSPPIGAHLTWIRKRESAPIAAIHSSATNIIPRNAVPSAAPHVSVGRIVKHDNPQAVYNLTIEGEREYFANGILVHNCDAARYLAWHLRYEMVSR